VTFAPLNLATDGYPGSLDLIVCRNVLMYFTDAARERTVERLNASLAPGGRLALSPLDAPPELGSPASAPPAVRDPEPPPPTPAPRVDTLVKARAEADGGRLDAARALCLETLRERPLDADAHLLLAAVEEERGDLDASIWALRRAIYTAPDGPAAHFRLGGLLLRTGAAEAGRRSFATAAVLLADADPGTLVDGLTAGEVLAAARAAS
jgi:chemotaxis protein methyltransferase CheR